MAPAADGGANGIIADAFTRHGLDLLRVEAGQRRRIQELLTDLEGELVAQLAKVDPTGVARESARVQRLEKLLAQVQDTIRASYRDASRDLIGELRELAEIEADFAVKALNDGVQTELFSGLLTRSQAIALVGDVLVQGAPISEWWARQAGDTLQRFTDEMRLGIAQGETSADLIRRIRGGTKQGEPVVGFMQISRRNADSLVRAATQAVAERAKDYVYDANADLLAAVVWTSTLDMRTTVQCFPEETLAFPVGGLLGVFRRAYQGDLVVITTTSGQKLRCTPNHPILTARGWRAAQEVEPGKEVVYRVVGDVGAVCPGQNVGVPASMGAIADALLKIPGVDVVRESASEADFHGDGQGGQHEIYRPRADCDLWAALNASGLEHVANTLFCGVHLSGLFAPDGHLDAAVDCDSFRGEAAKVCAVPVQDGVKAAFRHSEFTDDVRRFSALVEGVNNPAFVGAQFGFASPFMSHDASALEDAGDCCRGDVVALADHGGGSAVRVVAENVVSVEREFFSGHVVNLSTGSELYIANGLVVHNCQVRDGLRYTVKGKKPIGHDVPWLSGPGNLHWGCRSASRPETKSWRELGFDIDDLPPGTRASMNGQVPSNTTFEGWLARQPKDVQDASLGVGRADLWRDGKITFRDLLDANGRELSLDELRARL